MATQTIEFRAAAGLTLTAELFAIGSDTIVATASPTEQTNRAGTYRVAYTDIAAGEYQLVAFVGTTPVASWLVTLTPDTATFQVFERSTAVNMRGTNGANTVVPPTVAAFEARTLPSDDYATEAKQDTAKTAIDAILVDTDATIPATLAGMSGATFDTATDSLEAIRDRGDEAWAGGGEAGLTGPWTRTITVTDSVSGDPIQNATVRFFRTGETETKATDVSGVASFTVDAATWSYAIVASGYAGASGSVEVSESGDTAVTLVASVVSVADAPLCAVTLPIRDQYGQPLPATMVTLTFAGVAAGAAPAGVIMSPPPVQASDSAGIVQVNLIRLARYTATYRIGTQTRQVSFTVPDAGTFVVSD